MKRGNALQKTKNLGEIWLLGFTFILVTLNSSIAFALDPLGPPVATLEPGQIHLGIDYSSSTTDLLLKNGKGVESISGAPSGSGNAISLTLKDFEQNSYYANFGYGIDYNWEAFVRVSYTKAEFGDSLTHVGEKFESNSVPAIGGGIRATFFEGEYLKIGGIAQANMSHYNGKRYAPQWNAPHFVDTDITEIQFAIGASYMLIDSIWIYGGPIIHLINGEYINISITEADTGGLLLSEYSWDIEEDSMYGGYFGTQMDIGEDCSLSIEYQLTGGADALGASFVLRF